jgi:hypothetical protein
MIQLRERWLAAQRRGWRPVVLDDDHFEVERDGVRVEASSMTLLCDRLDAIDAAELAA